MTIAVYHNADTTYALAATFSAPPVGSGTAAGFLETPVNSFFISAIALAGFKL